MIETSLYSINTVKSQNASKSTKNSRTAHSNYSNDAEIKMKQMINEFKNRNKSAITNGINGSESNNNE